MHDLHNAQLSSQFVDCLCAPLPVFYPQPVHQQVALEAILGKENTPGILQLVLWTDKAQADGAGRHMLRPVWCTCAGWDVERQNARSGAECLGMMPRVADSDALQVALAQMLAGLQPFVFEGQMGEEGRCVCTCAAAEAACVLRIVVCRL